MSFFYSEEISLIFSGLDVLLAFSGELLDSGLINLFGPTLHTAVLWRRKATLVYVRRVAETTDVTSSRQPVTCIIVGVNLNLVSLAQ